MGCRRRSPARTLTATISSQVTLRELRQLAGKTQMETAGAAGMAQSEVSRIEGQRGALVTTLRRYVEALGGELELVARFGNRTMKISGIG